MAGGGLVVMMSCCTCSCLLLVLTLAVAAGGVSTQQCHEEDEAALLAVKKAGLGSPYQLSSWSTDTWCCDWTDVDCDNATGRVVGLSVSSSSSSSSKQRQQEEDGGNLTTGIPGEALAGLVHLRSLALHHLPGLTGPIPESLAQLSNLSELTISHTGVWGPVPAFLSQLAQLTQLDLSCNSLTGAIPASLGDLPGLYSIDLSRNRLDGPIPPTLFSKFSSSSDSSHDDSSYLQQQLELVLSHNNLSGGVPAEFADVSFAHVDLSRNALTGDPSPALLLQHNSNKSSMLSHLDLSRNGFRFSLTAVQELPEKLRFLDLSHNAIRGRIPAALANLTDLQRLDLSFNKLCGQLPRGGVMTRFDATSFQHNKCLCGAPLQACPP